MANVTLVSPVANMPDNKRIDQLVRQDRLRSMPPREKVVPMDSAETETLIPSEYHPRREKASFQIRSAELYEDTEKVEAYLDSTESLAQTMKAILTGEEKDSDMVKQMTHRLLEQIDTLSQIFKNRAVVRKKNDLGARSAAVDRSNGEPSPIRGEPMPAADVADQLSLMRDRISFQLNDTRENPLRPVSARPSRNEEDDGLETQYQTLKYDSNRLSDIEDRAEEVLSRLLSAFDASSSQNGKMSEGGPSHIQKALDQAIQEIQSNRENLSDIQTHYRNAQTDSDALQAPDVDEAERIAMDLAAFVPSGQLAQAQIYLTPQAVSQLLF